MQVSRIAMRCRALVWAARCWVCLGVAAQTLPAVAKADRVWALTEQMELIEFASDHPSQVLSRRPVTGLAAGDALVGMDFRVARGASLHIGHGQWCLESCGRRRAGAQGRVVWS